MSPTGSVRHLNDAELAALLEGDEGGAAASASHLAECPACAARVREMRDAWNALQTRLADAGPTPGEWARLPATPPARRPSVHARPGASLRRAAGVAGLLLLAGAAVTPIRAAVLEWAQRTWAATTRERPATPSPPAADDATPSITRPSLPGPEYRIAAPGPEARIAFRARPAGGTLTITPAKDGYLTLQSSGGAGDPVLALPDGFVIQNTPGSAGGYRLSVPLAIDRLWLEIASGRTLLTSDSLRAGPVVVPLASATAPDAR
jgi:hypothetical protein